MSDFVDPDVVIHDYRKEDLPIPKKLDDEVKELMSVTQEQLLLAEKYFAHYKGLHRPAPDVFFG
jgi:hypothetical protein